MKALAIVKYSFSATGLAMLIGAFFMHRGTSSFIEEAITAQGTVVELVPVRSDDSYTYKPIVKFTTDQGELVEFASSTSSNPPSYGIGETVAVLYRAGSPQNAKISGFFALWGGVVILVVLGGIFLSIGVSIISASALRARSDARLKTHGTRIKTELQRVELNESLTVNGQHPYTVVTQWRNPATSKVHVFRSRNLWFDPSSFITDNQVTVFIDASNPNKYIVDLSALPSLAD